MRFRDIPQFISDGAYECTMKLENFVKQIQEWVDEEGLQLCPNFQRGHVWTEEQQVKFMEFILQGGKTGRTIYLNDPYWHNVRRKDAYNDFVCVDGLQRITAIQRFLNNEIRVFGHLYSEFEDKTDLMRHGMNVNINDLKTEKEVLHWYIQMNSGGTPHSPEEIQRVREMMERCHQ